MGQPQPILSDKNFPPNRPPSHGLCRISPCGDPDYYLSFLISFNQVVSFLSADGIEIDETTQLRYVLATSTQTNSLNQDLGGIDNSDPNYDSNQTWTQLNAFSVSISANGALVPEPSAVSLLATVLLGLLLRRKKTA